MSVHQFRCSFPACGSNFQRKGHLERHKAVHQRHRAEFSCLFCDKRYKRSDTLRRHLKFDHESEPDTCRPRTACENCRAVKSRCDGGIPCNRCRRINATCSLHISTSHSHTQESVPSTTQREISGEHESAGADMENLDSGSLSEQIDPFIKLYFDKFHPRWPFIHRGSFDLNLPTGLIVQSMTVLGLWVSEHMDSRTVAISLHNKIRVAIEKQSDKWNMAESGDESTTRQWPISTYQAILLHLIFAAIHKPARLPDVNMRLEIDPADGELLDSLVSSCQRLGIFHLPSVINHFQGTGPLSYIWVSVEEVKRFSFALFRFCRVVNIPEQTETTQRPNVLSFDQLDFPFPKNDSLWNAVGKEEWDRATDNFEFTFKDDVGGQNWISRSSDVFRLLNLL